MATMPRGQPRSVPDEAGEQYDREIGRRQRDGAAEGPLASFQNGPPIPRPNLAMSLVPVVGPAWDAAVDLQEGDYAGAALNSAFAVADFLPVGVAVRGVRSARAGVGVLKSGSVTGNASAKIMRSRGVAGPGDEIHHSIALKGKSRTAQDPRNHFALLKVLPKADHRRLTGSWEGQPRYDPLRRIWYGTTDWQKVVPTTVVVKGADATEGHNQRRSPR